MIGRILLVEDDYLVALEVAHQLKQAGFSVVGVATTAEQAVSRAGSARPDLAVMDIRLAGARDVIDAATDLMTHHGVRSIFATAHGDSETRQRAAKARPLGWIEKPYQPARLIELLKEVLAGGL